MGFGVLEPHTSLEHVPGTAQLQDILEHETSHLKKGSGHNADIVLVPQPSSSPNDPLNWPLWQRDLILVLVCYLTNICVGAVGPLIGVLALDMLKAFNLDFTKVTLLSGYQLALMGAIAPLIASLPRKYGKRPSFLLSLISLFVGTIWCALATSYESMIGGRLIQGLGTSIFESVTFAIIGDLYFVHQRGSRMAIYITAQVSLVLFPSLMSGVVAVNLGWRWCFWILAIFLGIGFLLVLFFGWETSYNRNSLYEIDVSSHDNIHIIEEIKSDKMPAESGDSAHLERTITTTTTGTLTRDSFLKRMKPWSTTYSDEPLYRLMFRPFYILLNPVILWGVILIGFFQLWNLVINFMLGQLFGPPPYLLNTAQLGYLGAGPMVLGCVFCVIFGSLSDRIVKWASKRNGGIYEPEFRLIPMAIAPVLSSIGYFCFGPFAAQGKSPVIMSVLWGVAFASCVVVTAAVGGYLVDAYRNVTIEVFVVSMCLKSFLFFGFSVFLNNWLAGWGPERVFNTIGGISLAFCASTVLVFVYGKKVRAWWHTHDIFKST